MGDTGTLKCPNCGALNRADDFYCTQCHTNLHMRAPIREAVVAASAGAIPPSDSASTATPHGKDSLPASPVVGRYKDAYRIASALVGLGNAIKTVGVVMAGLMLLGSVQSRGPFGGGELGILLAIVIGGLSWVGGVMVAAQGQILRATLDNAVANSPFLNDPERAEAMGLPQTAVRSVGV